MNSSSRKFLSNVCIVAVPFALLLLSSVVGNAQSGRRQNKAQTTTPTPVEDTTPAVPEKQDKKKLDYSLAVGIERSTFAGLPLWFFSTVLHSCADRLQTGDVDVSASDQDVTRSDALKAAKASTNTYSIWLQLQNESSQSAADDFVIEYVVFAPTTAKVVTSGRAYSRGYRKGPIVVGPTTTPRTSNTMTVEYLLKEAGRDVADRILSALHIGGVNIPKG